MLEVGPEVIVELLSDNEVEAPVEEKAFVEEKPKQKKITKPISEKQRAGLVSARTRLAEIKRKEKFQNKVIRDFILSFNSMNLTEVPPEPVKTEPKEKRKPGRPKKTPKPEPEPVSLKQVLFEAGAEPVKEVEIEPEPAKPLTQLEINRILKANMKLKKKKKSSRR